MTDDIETVVCDLSKAPPHIRREIQSMGGDGRTHSFGDYEKLSNDTKNWLRQQAHENQGALQEKIRVHYQALIDELYIADIGVAAMSSVMPKEEAQKLNLALYNACAKICRTYNEDLLK